MKIVLIIALALLAQGCLTTTFTISRNADGTVSVTQPKDVCFDELTYSIDGHEVLTIKKYSSMANVQAMQIQSDAMANVANGVATGVVNAMKAIPK